MKRELGIARCGLACCLCSENATVLDAIQGNALIKSGAKLENARYLKTLSTVITVLKNAEKES